MVDLSVRIAYRFRDPELREQIFSHRSYRHENADRATSDNERLEFLGDALLGFLVSRMLFERFPDKLEGELSRLRAQLVSAQHLARKARALALGEELKLGRGEEMSGGREKDSLLADAYESLIAGVLLDGGFEAARDLVQREFADDITRAQARWPVRDYKSQLQETLHAQGHSEPVYRVVREVGPDHRKLFEVVVAVGEREVGRGVGTSKKAAQQDAARSAIDDVGRLEGRGGPGP